ncbi:NALCN channel auxiliary factor 1-like [Salvelinus sp. IW2-2015]|uniref:NALCN channel auxiliary factor 1-like n=1 Tax=Salvelinus sp. IW2-2015 TaxID=2691554 RepID=UPI000CEB37C6|nr:transmembrane protein FAM155A-like [Salvelinus alpinus]
MTRGVWMCRQQDDGLKIWFAPRENEKPFTESERAQRWRLSLASLLFITVLLSDHLWFCGAEAKLTRTRDKWQDKQLAFTDMAEYLNSTHHHHIHSSDSRPPHSRLNRELDVIFIGNSTKPLWRLDICHPDSLSKDCFTFTDAEPVCLGLSGGGEEGTQSTDVNLSDLYLSFCNSYSLLDLFSGFTSPDNINCSLDVAEGDTLGCSECVRAYQRFDRQAQEDYQEFELLVGKYETDEYSVRTCMEECKVGCEWIANIIIALAIVFFFVSTHLYGVGWIPSRHGNRCQSRCGNVYIFFPKTCL